MRLIEDLFARLAEETYSVKYFLLANVKVHKVSYGPSFYTAFYGSSAEEGKKRGSITCRTDRANEANTMFIT